MEKDDIEKIDEHIQLLSGKPKNEETVESSDTKVVDELESIESPSEVETMDEEVVTEEMETDEMKEPSSEEMPVEKEENFKEQVEGDIKPKKKKIWPFIILGIVLLIVIILCIALKPTKKKDVTRKELTKAQQKEIIDEYGEALQGIIGVYYEKDNVLLQYDDAIELVHYDYDVVCDEHEIYDDATIYIAKCSIDDQDTEYTFGVKKKKEEPKEGSIKVYVFKKTKEATLDTPNNVKDYDVYSFDLNGTYDHLELLGEKSDYVYYYTTDYKTKMMNYKTGKKALENIDYEVIEPIVYNGKNDLNYVIVGINGKKGIYNLNTGEKVVDTIYNTFVLQSGPYGVYGPSVVAYAVSDGIITGCKEEKVCGVINYRSNREIIPFRYEAVYLSGTILVGKDADQKLHLFEMNGAELIADKFDLIYGVVSGQYVLVKDGDHTKIVSINGSEIYDYGNLELGSYQYGLEYQKGATFHFTNPNAEKDNYEEGCIELIYDPKADKGEVKTTFCGGVAKPILYLYPEKTTKVTVSFEHPELLETTYPKFVDRWEVTAKKNGDLTDKNGKYYYGLYWDEAKVHMTDFSTGFYVTKDNAITFLEEKLSTIGLNGRERNEFITYWLPILEKNGQSLVYFELTEERESYNPIYINPKPDSLLRIVIHIKKVDHKINILKQNLTKFKRRGFVAVEWGGTTY